MKVDNNPTIKFAFKGQAKEVVSGAGIGRGYALKFINFLRKGKS